MVYLISFAVFAGGIALWKLFSRPDPHHIFFLSLLPLLDVEHTIGVRRDVGIRMLKAKSHDKLAA